MPTFRTYNTNHIGLAAALYTKGFNLVSIQHQENGWAEFTFQRKTGERIEDVAEGFQRGTLQLPAKPYFDNLGHIKREMRTAK